MPQANRRPTGTSRLPEWVLPLLPFSDADDGHNNNTERNGGREGDVPIRKGAIAAAPMAMAAHTYWSMVRALGSQPLPLEVAAAADK